MFSRSRILALAAVCALAFGCNKSVDNSGPNPPSAAVNGPTQQDRFAHEAKMVVSDFLEAMRRGDEAKARSLLTKVARQKADAQKGFIAQGGGDDGGKVEVDDPSFPSPDDHEVAHVPTRWIDQDEMGKPRTERATWVCRLEPEGWRVAGFAAYVFEGEDPIFMNFEDPEDMARHRQMMDEEIERRSKPEAAPRSSGERSLQAENKPKDAFRR